MCKLKKEKAELILNQVFTSVRLNPSLRLGQALFTALPSVTANLIFATENDFFYWRDDKRVLEAFYAHCVEK